jgi:PEP-CTERM motif
VQFRPTCLKEDGLKKILLIAIALISLGTLAYADSFVVYGSRAAQPIDDIIDWGQVGPPGTLVTTPFFGSTFLGNPFLAGNTNGSNFYALQEGNGWNGGFDYGESLVWTGNPNFVPAGFGPFAVVLGTPASTFGFSIEADLIADYTVNVQAYDSSGDLLFQNNFFGKGGCGFGNSCVLFVGMGDLNGANISEILISTDQGDPMWNNDFAIDDVSLGYGPAVPEPGSLLLMGTGLLGAVGVMRRKLNL